MNSGQENVVLCPKRAPLVLHVQLPSNTHLIKLPQRHHAKEYDEILKENPAKRRRQSNNNVQET